MYELLAPAGNKECALAAIHSGADAVYLGYSAFSARAGAENFDMDGLTEIIKYAHVFGVKIYVTMNTLVKESESETFLSTLIAVHNAGADGILLQDVFLGKTIHERYPQITLHLSTQAGVNNLYGAILAKEYGFSRVVLARETGLKDIGEIAKIIESEVFVQGALCTCFSGQCYFSSFAGGNSGNRGRCKQPCRKKYTYDRADGRACYALSLSDLSVGEKIADLLDMGVVSFKIEGRMRRPEYVAAAVAYYKKLLTSERVGNELSDLRRTYNRGNYTSGLAFGQDKRFLSSAVQGHIGEKVGVIKVINGRYYTESRERFSAGDGFKILRGGEEVGGAVFAGTDKRGFFLSSRERLKNGDGVFITTDTALNARLSDKKRKREVNVLVTVDEEGRMTASGESVKLQSSFALQSAKNSPLTPEELTACFVKTDAPFTANVRTEVKGNFFAPKSVLNAFRREFYSGIYARLTENGKERYVYKPFAASPVRVQRGGKLAVIGRDFTGIRADIYIYKPRDYLNADAYRPEIPAGGELYLYLPAFLSGEEISFVEGNISFFDGVYAEGTYGLKLAERTGKKLFAGTGFNLTNSNGIAQRAFTYYALSKELDFSEQRILSGENAFVLSAGSLKLMDLLYCPFGKKCASCENRERYILTDESGRKFTVLRYRAGAGCRFELFNCAPLVAPQSFANTLIDISDLSMSVAKAVCENYTDEGTLKKILPGSTAGHSKNTVL